MFSELLKYPTTFGPMKDGFEEWHKGRAKYCVWAIEPKEDLVVTRFYDAQHHLLPYLIPNYDRKIHITIGQAGFLALQKHYPDDYLMTDLAEDIARLQSCPLELIQCLFRNVLISYAIAPGFEILDDDKHLSSLNQLLCRAARDDSFVYFPHITVGLYNGEWNTPFIAEKLTEFPIEANINVMVDKIKLISYQPSISGGVLEDELVFDLQTNRVVDSNFNGRFFG